MSTIACRHPNRPPFTASLLSHDAEHAEARQFFTVLGTLDATLVAIGEKSNDPEVTTDLFGNPVLTASGQPSSAASIQAAVGM